MGWLGHLPDMWRLLREIDLEAVRRDAERPFQVLLVAEDGADAQRLATLLTGEVGARHPWLLPVDAVEGRKRAGSGVVDAALIVSRSPELPFDLASTLQVLRAAKIPVTTVVLGQVLSSDTLIRPGESGRVAVAALEPVPSQ